MQQRLLPHQEIKALVVVALGYFIGAEIAFGIGTLSDNFYAPFWLPNTILFAALVLAPYQRWWRYALAVLPVHVAVEWQVAMPPPQVAVAFATNCAVAGLNAAFVKEVLVRPPWLNSFVRAGLFIIGTACINPALVAFGGAFVRSVTDAVDYPYWTYWAQWYAANALGSLTLGPILLILGEYALGQTHRLPLGRAAEGGIVATLLAFTCAVAFGAGSRLPGLGFLPAMIYLPMPLVLWAAVRFGIKGASGAILIVTATAVWAALQGDAAFASTSAEMNVLALQLFLTGLAVPVLLVGATIESIQRDRGAVRELAQTLLSSRDDERRHTAKQLHEGVCQELAAASLIARHVDPLSDTNLSRNLQLLQRQLHKSIRELSAASYLLHPPLLDEGGLEPALSSLVHELIRDTDMRVRLEVPRELGRLPAETELVLFRLVQDALAQLIRNTNATHVVIRLTVGPAGLTLTVSEGSKSRTAGLLSFVRRATWVPVDGEGVGIAGMRERLHRVGGRLEFESVGGQIVVRAMVETRTPAHT